MIGAFGQAIRLLVAGDREVYFIAWTSLRLSLVSVVIASALSLPLGFLIGLKSFPGKKSLIAASPVMKEGEVIGGLGVSIFLDDLSNTLAEELALPEDMVFYATTEAGEVVLHSDTQIIFETNPILAENVVYETSPLTGWRFALGYKD